MRAPPITIAEALDRLLPRLRPVESESLPLIDCGGRVLARPIAADRDSPAIDVSAMDGFAVRQAEIEAGPLPIEGECRIGHPPEKLPPGAVLKIFTGSPLPLGADTVVKVEETSVDDQRVTLTPEAKIRLGSHIRRQAENGERGRGVLPSGVELTTAAITALASVTAGEIAVHRRVRVAIITTGNELIAWDAPEAHSPEPWRLRDSNGPALLAMLSDARWLQAAPPTHAGDTPDAIHSALSDALQRADAAVFTGGVSMGDHDYVPRVVREAGGEILFHGLRIRPGKPTLGALAGSKPVLGLPGNPLSVLTTGLRVLAPALRRLGGFMDPTPARSLVRLVEPGEKTLPLEWHRPITLSEGGSAQLSEVRGSGDVLGAAQSDGIVAVPPDTRGEGPYSFYPWRL